MDTHITDAYMYVRSYLQQRTYPCMYMYCAYTLKKITIETASNARQLSPLTYKHMYVHLANPSPPPPFHPLFPACRLREDVEVMIHRIEAIFHGTLHVPSTPYSILLLDPPGRRPSIILKKTITSVVKNVDRPLALITRTREPSPVCKLLLFSDAQHTYAHNYISP